MVGNAELCLDVDKMTEWYQSVMDMQVLERFEAGEHSLVVMTDKDYDPVGRRTLFFLHNARHDFELKKVEEHGPHISAIIYQAKDVQRAWEDALWAGMKPLLELHKDPLTGLTMGYLAEPCGSNVILLTEHYAPEKQLAAAA
jgi:4-hydroxyphenylpyruvate dioxygenase-like putative hemolysin